MENKINIDLTVNGKPVTATVPTKANLLDFLGEKKMTPPSANKLSLMNFLREDLRLTGTKNGCGTDHCGSCMVLVNGQAKMSCLLRMENLENADVVTIEGIAEPGDLHPIQAAYMSSGGTQCGFCTPGMIMATKALLDNNPNPTDEEIMDGLKDVICRCTGYNKIIDAAKLSARWMQNPEEMESMSSGGLGCPVDDFDGVGKVQGSLDFGSDLFIEGMLHLKALWSEHPHALIKGIDTTEAEKVPGVIRVMTAADVPGHNGFGPLTQDQPVLCGEKVRFLGDAVALVAAESEEIAEKARNLIKVDYEPLPGVFSPSEVAKELSHLSEEDADQISSGNSADHEIDDRLCKHLVHKVGDIEQGLSEADLVVEGHFDTPAIEHAYLEPETGVAYWDDDVLVLKVPTQSPYEMRTQMAKAMGLPDDQMRIIVTPSGGAFGSKFDAVVEPLLVLATYCTRRPTKMTLTREESLICSVKRHPYELDYRVGLDKNGKILAVDAKMVSDAGPYTELSPRVIDQACLFACGPYEVPHLRLEGWAVHTNNVRGSAFRGMGINQVAFALESLLDEAAEKLDISPFDLRYRNAVKEGSKTASGQILRDSVALEETLEAARSIVEKELPRFKEKIQPGNKLGIGIASGFKNVGAGKGKIDEAGATLTLLPGGKVELRIGVMDFGQGIRTAMAQIARTILPFDANTLELVTGDTLLTQKSWGACAQRQTLICGFAVLKATELFKDELLAKAASVMEVPASELTYMDSAICHMMSDNQLSLEQLEQQLVQKEEVVMANYRHVAPKTFALADVEGRNSVPPEEYRNYPTFAYATQASIVEVNPQNGHVKVLCIVAAHDVGVAINPKVIEGQLEGSCSQGLGYALSEDFPVVDGIPQVRTYRGLKVPSILETPEIITAIIEKPEPAGPFGAKGISEVATVPVTPAITNAIYDAVKVRIYDLPATPAKILAGLGANGH